MKSLYSEFKRRNVFRVAVLYLVSAWLIAQVADVIIGLGELPPAIGRTVLIVLALGFPVALIVSWVFQWTPEGIRLESEVDAGPFVDRSAGRRLDYVIISLLSVALIYFVVNHDWQGPPPVAGASIAVLPFENRSAQPDDLYFTDGIHEDILTQLGKISSMVVISRTSVMQYRGSVKTIPEIASELSVSTILEGGVQRAGNRVRINMQLIDAASDRHLWAETYDRELSADNVFAIQSEVAASIADALHARLLPEERQSIEAVPTHILAAYDAYLLGRRLLASRDEEDLARAQDYFKQAVELDPAFALAYAGLADSLLLLSAYDGTDPVNQIAEAEGAAIRALELNPRLGEAHTSFGLVKKFKGDSPKSYAADFARAVELSPSSADARRWYANYLAESGRREEALEQMLKAVQLDPLSPIIRVNLANNLRELGRPEEASAHIKRALEIDPKFMPAIFHAGQVLPVEQGLAATSQAYRANSDNPWALLELVLGYLELRDPARAELWAAEFDRIAPDSPPAYIAHLNLGIYHSRQAQALDYAKRLLPMESGTITVPSRTLLLDDLKRGDTAAALERYRHKYPYLLSDDPEISGNYSGAIDVAMLMMALGEVEKADKLLDRSLAFLSSSPDSEAQQIGVFTARIHAMRGQTEEALAALREAINAGWRFQWWYFMEQDPALKALHGDPRFELMRDELNIQTRAELEAVRQLEANGEVALPPAS